MHLSVCKMYLQNSAYKGSVGRLSQLSLYFSVAVALSGVLSEITRLTGTVGRSITLHTGDIVLHADDHIIWTYGSARHVLLNVDGGKVVTNESQRFHLDGETGSLTFRPLSNESGLYEGQIINGHSSTHLFNLTVLGTYFRDMYISQKIIQKMCVRVYIFCFVCHLRPSH